MQTILKVNSLLYKSNNFKYGQLLLNKNIILTTRSDLLTKHISLKSIKNFEKLVNLYNNKIISYTTLKFLLNKFNKNLNTSSDYSFLKLLLELSWESGIFLNKGMTFTKR